MSMLVGRGGMGGWGGSSRSFRGTRSALYPPPPPPPLPSWPFLYPSPPPSWAKLGTPALIQQYPGRLRYRRKCARRGKDLRVHRHASVAAPRSPDFSRRQPIHAIRCCHKFCAVRCNFSGSRDGPAPTKTRLYSSSSETLRIGPSR